VVWISDLRACLELVFAGRVTHSKNQSVAVVAFQEVLGGLLRSAHNGIRLWNGWQKGEGGALVDVSLAQEVLEIASHRK